MKPVQISFGREGSGLGVWLNGRSGSSRWRALAGMILLAAGPVAMCVIGWISWQTQQRIRAAEIALHTLRAEQGAATDLWVQREVRLLLGDEQRRYWNRVSRHLNTPWSAILDGLETSRPDGIALLSIEPDATQGSVRLQVEAKTLDTLLGYAAILGATEPFESVALVKHETSEQDPTRPFRLSLEANLRSQQISPAAAKEFER